MAHPIRALLRADFPTQCFAPIAASMQILAGKHAPALETVRLTHRTIPARGFKRISGAGHLSDLEQPEAFPNQMLHFLRGIEVDSGV